MVNDKWRHLLETNFNNTNVTTINHLSFTFFCNFLVFSINLRVLNR